MKQRFVLPMAAFLVISCGLGWPGELAAQEFAFTNLLRLTNKEMTFRLTAPAGQNYRIDAATNLPDWTPLLTFQSAGWLQHTDSAAPFLGTRFYRASQVAAYMVTGDHWPTEAGEVTIHPLNHSGLALNWDGRMIYSDVTNRSVNLPRADLILLTHTHNDHVSQTAISNIMGPNVVLIAPQAVYNSSLSAYLRSRTTVLTNGASTTWMGLSILAFPMYNTTSSSHVKGAGNGYILSFGDKKLYISGDTQETSEMRALTNIDIAFLAMNNPYTLSSVAEAVSAIRSFSPKIVYPCHYRNSDGTFMDLSSIKQQVLANPGVEVRLRNWY